MGKNLLTMGKINSVLFSCIGGSDRKGADDNYEGNNIGSIARALLNQGDFSYSKVIIFSDKKDDKDFEEKLMNFCLNKVELKPEFVFENHPVKAMDRAAIYELMRHLIEDHTPNNEPRTFLLSSGTPAMHLCWTLLAHTVQYKARLVDASRKEGIEEVPHWVELSHSLVTKANTEDFIGKLFLDLSKEVKEHQIIGHNKQLKEAIGMASYAAKQDLSQSVVIYGETGTGKEAFAQLIHQEACSSGGQSNFKVINCKSLAEGALESQLFGHTKGAFTGAGNEKKGLFQSVKKGGTVFLDEIGDMPLDLQTKLLRVIQERTILPVGATTELPLADFRIVVASHKSLERGVDDGWFREDLFYRLNNVMIPLPALRDRLEDVDALCQYFIGVLNNESRLDDSNKVCFSDNAFPFLKTFVWAGNIRELENTVKIAFGSIRGCVANPDIAIEEPIIDADFLKEVFVRFPSPKKKSEIPTGIANHQKEKGTTPTAIETALEKVNTDPAGLDWANRDLDKFDLNALFQDVAYHYYQRARKHWLNENALVMGSRQKFVGHFSDFTDYKLRKFEKNGLKRVRILLIGRKKSALQTRQITLK